MESVAEKALQNPLIVNAIVQYFEKSNILAARAVNRQWQDIFNPILEETCQIEFYWHYEHKGKSFYVGRERDEDSPSEKQLSKFNDFLEKTDPAKFPCTSFKIMAFHEFLELDKDVERFFIIQGRHIRALEFMTHLFPTRVEFYNLLFNLLPRLESLRLHFDKFGDWKKELRLAGRNFYKPTDLSLPALKKFEWDYCDCDEDILTDILTNAPNLNEVEFYNQSDLEVVLKAGKAFAVKTLIMSNQKDTSSLALEFANQTEAKLEKLGIHWYARNEEYLDDNQRQLLIQSLFTLIQSSRNSLTHLELLTIESVYSDWVGLDFGQLPRVRELSIGNNCGQLVLPSKIDLSKSFPNLYLLDLSTIGECDSPIQDFNASFRHTWNLTTVKVLEISVRKNQLWLQQLRDNLCPNFHSLVIHVAKWHEDLPAMMKNVFQNLHHLVSLEMKYVRYFSCDLDPVLLGLNQTCVDELNQKLKNGAEIETIELLPKIGPCILDMKNLKRFELNFRPKIFYLGSKPFPAKPLLFSHLSWVFGFEQVPEIDVRVYIDRNDIEPDVHELMSIRPFAKFYNKRTGKRIENDAPTVG